jgi:hypothetical protein
MSTQFGFGQRSDEDLLKAIVEISDAIASRPLGPFVDAAASRETLTAELDIARQRLLVLRNAISATYRS